MIILGFLLVFPVIFKFSDNPSLMASLSSGVVLLLHIQRTDKNFLLISLRGDKRLYFFHYHLLSIPIYIVLILANEFLILVCLFTAVNLLPFLVGNYSFAGFQYDIIRFIPFRNFEFKSGLRQNFFTIVFIYAVCVVFYESPFVALTAILLVTFVCTSFYSESEPGQMLEVYRMSAKRFLRYKITNQLIDFVFLILPLISIFLVVNIRYWYVLAIFLIISAIIQTLSICLKYAFYEPGRTINKSIFIAVYALSIFVPFFVPVPLIMMVHYFRKAESNLNHFLYDYS